MVFENGKEIPLWPSKAVLSHGNQPGIDIPTITPYFPPIWKANGKAIIIYPGGTYVHLTDHEGRDYAEFFSLQGFHCFVVKYRLGSYKGYYHPVELSDAARGVRMVRAGAEEMGIKPDCIGVMGASAGGHLAATVCNLHSVALKSADEGEVARISSRPDFAILCYAVITSDPHYCNQDSFRNLLGEANFNENNCRALSQECNVTADTPPTFLWHTMQDNAVPCENSILYAKALRKHGIPFELHIYEKGGHGGGLAKGHPWAAEALRWIETL